MIAQLMDSFHFIRPCHQHVPFLPNSLLFFLLLGRLDKVSLNAIPHFQVIFLKSTARLGPWRCLKRNAAFKHERHCSLCNNFRLEFHFTVLFKALAIWPMGGHVRVQCSTSWKEALCLCLIVATNKAHKFTHAVAMVIWGTESVLVHRPAWRENRKVYERESRHSCWCCQNSENGWIKMIERNRVHNAEFRKIIFERSIISMPTNNVEWSVVLFSSEHDTLIFVVHNKHFIDIFIRSNRCEEITRVGKTIGSNWSQRWDHIVTTKNFTDISTRWAIHIHLELDSSLNHANLVVAHFHDTKFSLDGQCTKLWNNEHVTIRRIHCTVVHGCVARIYVNTNTSTDGWISTATNGGKSLHKVHLLGFFW
eukprot:m.5202 g.5202  ORF g.5202 m.5202 type:complete len:365 (+) comp2356_c0_seq1:310-1404(+)